MAKEISLPLEEYNTDLKSAKVAGINLVIQIVRDIFATGGQNISMTNSADPEFIKFMDELKVIKGKVDAPVNIQTP